MLVGVVVALGAAAGTGVRATYGAQVTADEPQYLLSALSLAEDGDLDVADELAAERWRAFHESDLPEQTRPLPGGRRLSPHNPLLPVLLAVPVALGGWVGAKLALAAVAGLLAALLVWTAVRRFHVPPAAAAAVVLVFGLSPPLAVYGTQVYPELPAAVALTAAVAALTGKLRSGGVAVLGAAVVALPWLGVKYAPVAAALAAVGALRLGRRRDWRALGALTAGLAAAAAVYAWAHVALYGGVTPYAAGDHFVGGELDAVGFDPNYAGRAVRLSGLLTDARFGLAAWQPAWLLLLPAAGALAARRPPGWGALLAPLAAGWLTATVVALTMHGWWWPGRQVVVVVPAAVLTVAWWVGAWWARRTLPAARAAAGFRAPDRPPAPARSRVPAPFRAFAPFGRLWTAVWPPPALETRVRAGGKGGGRGGGPIRIRRPRPVLGLLELGLLGAGLLGVLAYAWLVVDGLAGRLTWVVDFWETGNPLYRAWRAVLPDFLEPDAWTWPLHAVWSAALAALAVAGWRGARLTKS